MKGSLLFLILALYVSCVVSDDCDFSITSVEDLENVLSDQNWSSNDTKVLCFAPGNYSYNTNPLYTISAPQEWRGARANDDPSCNQYVNTPCKRLRSAMSFDITVESVFYVENEAGSAFLQVHMTTFNFTGFSVYYQSTSSLNFVDIDGSDSTLNLYHNYIKTSGSFNLFTINAYYNYFDGQFGTTILSASSGLGIAQHNYFTHCYLALLGFNMIQYNSFVKNAQALSQTSTNMIVSNNLFVLNLVVSVISSGLGATWNNNSLILNGEGIPIKNDGYSLTASNNCFVDNNQNLQYNHGNLTYVYASDGNYFGPSELTQGWTDVTYLGTPVSQSLPFSYPLVCPKSFLSFFVPQPHSIIAGEPMEIHWTFEIGASLTKLGAGLSFLNQSTITFSIYNQFNNPSASHNILNFNDTINLNNFGAAKNILSYSLSLNDLPAAPIHGTSLNYTLVANIDVSFNFSGTPLSHSFIAIQGITVSNDIPVGCRNRDSILIIPKIERFKGPVNLNLTDIFCDTNEWSITGIHKQPLASPPLSVNSDHKSVRFAINPAKSGAFNFIANITSVHAPSVVHKIVTHVNLTNHNPIVTPYTYFNYTQWSQVGNVNLLANSSDPDSDTFKVTHIYARGGKNATNINDLSVYFHFANDSFVVVASPSGNLSIHDVGFTSTLNCSADISMSGLNVVGNSIYNGNNQKVKLIGVNRSGTESSCVQGSGFSDGPVDAASIAAMKAWNINTVRVPVNEDCWLGINGASPSGTTYQNDLKTYLDLLTDAGFAIILDLHWTAVGSTLATGPTPMPDASHAPSFWQSVANAYSSYSNVIFDLFDSPYPCFSGSGMSCSSTICDSSASVAWQCWLYGGTSCPGLSYTAAGMQSLVNSIRSSGATNIIIANGIHYASCLNEWSTYQPTDPLQNMIAGAHIYPGQPCSDSGCWNSTIQPLASNYPVIFGEIGEYDCDSTFIEKLMAWADNLDISYLAYTWNTWDCASGPALISTYAGVASTYGAGFKSHLAATLPNCLPTGVETTYSPVAGSVRSDLTKFKSSFGLNFVVDDGDRVNHLAEGNAIFDHLK